MRTLRVLSLALLLAAAVGGGCGTNDADLKLIHVQDLVGLLASHEGGITLLDANGSEFRAREGLIPGAVQLSSYKTYDVERELPSRKDAPLVFYCADSH